MAICSAYKCKSRGDRKVPGISFHRFPKDEEKRSAWIRNMRLKNWTPSKHDMLCSLHFESRFFYVTDSKKVNLLYGAIPTIFPELPAYMQPKKVTIRQRIDRQPVPSSSEIQVDPDSPRKEELQRKIFQEVIKSHDKSREIRVLRQSLKRCKKRVITLKQIIKVLTQNASPSNT